MKKILIMYATFGTGHKSIAKYVEEYFKLNNKDVEVKNININEYMPSFVSNFTTGLSNKIILSSNQLLWGAIYGYFNSKVTTFGTYRLISKLFDTEKLKNEVVEYNPDLVISMHFFSSSSIARYKRKGYINSKLVTIITDYQSHEMWLKNVDEEDALIVGNKEEKREIVAKGIDPSKIKIYGIPISSRFNEEYNKKEIMKKYGFSGKPIYLFYGGGGCGSSTSIPYLKKILKLNLDVNVIYVAGSNEKLKNKAKNLVNKYGNDNIRVFGFVNNVPELLTISDAVITKPGGVTVTECLVLKKPMLLITKTEGHEKGNFKYLTKNGFALNCSTLDKFEKNFILINENEKILEKARTRLSKNSSGESAMEKLYKYSMDLISHN